MIPSLPTSFLAFFAITGVLLLPYPTTPEECGCYAKCYRNGNTDPDPTICFCPLYSCGGEKWCDPHETAHNSFWCKCIDQGVPPTPPSYEDGCLCKSGWNFGEATGNHYRQCGNKACTHVCKTMKDDEVPVGDSNALQACDCK